MNLNQVMTELDALFTQERISEVPQFLEEHIEQARAAGEQDIMLTLYNECIGFYRETGQYDKSIENCDKAIALMEEMGLNGTMPYATTLLNIANAQRAAGHLQESLEFYNKVRPIYAARLKEDDMYFAGLYNNLSLLYQEMGDFGAAKEQLENALKIVSHKENTAFEVAVTQANLANTCIELGQDEEAKARAEEAIRIFEEIGVDDAHYSAALSALGSLYYMDKDYSSALSAMEKSRECVAKYLGAENIQYKRLSDNIKIIQEKIGEEEPKTQPTQAEEEVKEEDNTPPMNEEEIDKILGIDIDNDGWASVIRADRNTDDEKACDEHKADEDVSETDKESERQEEAGNPADSVSTFDINSAFADIKAAASKKLQEHSGKKYQANSVLDIDQKGVSDSETGSNEEARSLYDEEKAVDAMIAEVMDEIAVEVEEASEVDQTQENDTKEDTNEGNAQEEAVLDSPKPGILEESVPENTDADLPTDVMGLELCRKYYEEYGRPMIAEKFPEYETRIAVGLVGKGSDCFGFDDMQSRDHDFGPRFLMWVTKEVYDKIGSALEEAYEKLPDTFLGIKRIETFHGKDRAGVMVIEDFYKNILGVDLIGALTNERKGLAQVKSWLAVHDYALAASVNGAVFRDDEGIFTSYRELLAGYYPKTVWYRKIAQACALFSQNGQYNLPRMRKRGQFVAAELAKAECVKQAMKLYYLLNRTYAPHDKWLFKNLPDNANMVLAEEGMQSQEAMVKSVSQLVEEISLTSVDKAYETQLTTAVESLAVIFANALEHLNIIGSCDLYLDANTAELIAKSDALLAATMADAPTVTALSLSIAKAEFEAFDKVQNEGGRASCQNNWPTFKVMRMSQYMTWDEDMLLQYLYEFKTNYANGRNMVEEKYARMMASTAPEEYAAFADKLPQNSKEKQEIMEQIIALQVKWMEEFAQQYPKLADNARTIHTNEDLPYDTSYETYLRGELGTYSDKLIEMYGRYVVEYARNGKSVAREIMANTVRFYGYKSFEEAESKQMLN